MNHVQVDLLESVTHLLDYAKKGNVDGFEISAQTESGFAATARMGALENLEHHREMRVTISVYKEQRSASVSASDVSLAMLQQSFDKACSIAQYTQVDIYSGLADAAFMAYDYPDLSLAYPWDITPERAIEWAINCDHSARQRDSRITQVDEAVVTTTSAHYVYANSHGFIGHYPSTAHSLSLSLVAQQNKQMERDYDYCQRRNAAELLSPERVAAKAADRVLQRLGARKITTRRCPVIFESRVAKSLVGHFIQAISGARLYRKTSFLVDALGKKVFPEFININQKPHLIAGAGSMPFDHQGVKTKDLHYIRDGKLEQYVLGHYSAKKLGLTTTGNAGGVFNLFVDHSDKDLNAWCREIGEGLLVTELLGQGVNLLSGDYSRGAAGFWVAHGEIQHPVHEVTIAANLKDMFADLLGVANDVDPHSNIVTGSIAVADMMVAGY